jgi:uncharacterized protein (TIGR00369 family)
MDDPDGTIAATLDALSAGFFPGLVGLRITAAARGEVDASLDIRAHHLAPNGYLHAAVVVALADTSCGYGVRTALPPGAVGFTTIELKANFLGTARDGAIGCEARLVHGGRTTQVWDATVRGADRTIALFRCTQLVLYPQP